MRNGLALLGTLALLGITFTGGYFLVENIVGVKDFYTADEWFVIEALNLEEHASIAYNKFLSKATTHYVGTAVGLCWLISNAYSWMKNDCIFSKDAVLVVEK